jgi:arylsulfatase A-like enzyme
MSAERDPTDRPEKTLASLPMKLHRRPRRPPRTSPWWLLPLLLAGCDAPGALRVSERYADLSVLDGAGMGRFRGAIVAAAAPVETREVAIHGDRRAAIVLEAPSRLSLRAAADASRFRFGLAVRPPDAKLRIAIYVDGQLRHDENWQEQRDWVERSLDLGEAAGRPRTLEIELSGAGASVMLGHPETLAPTRGDAAQRPNLIVYVVDCLRADHVGAYGYSRPTTPHLDALARDGVLLEELSSCAPWTKPSTGCLFTSLLPTSHRARTVDDALPREHVTLAERLQAEGFRTLAWVANPVIEPDLFHFNQGFDRWVDLRSSGERSGAAHINALEPDAADITRGVLPWLEAHRDEQFFLYLHSLDLHYEYRARAPFDRELVSPQSTGLERDRELYDSELAYNDHEIGRLVSALRKLDLYDETLIYVTSDHGEEFGEHDSARHGKTLYEQLLHIPGILKLPRSQGAGRRVAGVAGNIDVAPTLLEMVGAAPAAAMQGRSLLPAIESGSGEPGRMLFAELVAPQIVAYAARGDRYKYVKQLVPELREQLFDLTGDPGETRNLVDSPPGAAHSLFGALDRFLMRGQHGYHLSALHPATAARVRVRVSSDGAFREAFRFGIETGDVLELSADRRSVTLEFTAGATRRHLVLQTEPQGAPLSIEMSADGASIPAAEILLGSAATPAVAMPIENESARVSPAEVERLLGEDGPAIQLWYVPLEAAGNPVALDEEALENLRALGYIQ